MAIESPTSVVLPVTGSAQAALMRSAESPSPRKSSISAALRIAARGSAMGVYPQLDIRLAEGGLEALRAGDPAEHDRLVAAAVAELEDVDVVMLGQYSMARAAAVVQTPGDVPLLTSPHAAVHRLRELLG